MTNTRKVAATDIPADDWIDRWLPRGARPYLRLARIDRPIGIWLLMFPCWWSTALATPGWPDPWLLGLFAVGATLMRGAGCTLNDLVDRDFDARVARTAGRPIPSGAVRVHRAVFFMIALCLAALLVLLQFNAFAVALGASSLLLVAVYPFAKRVTYWPQAVLGLTFNWGALLGWAAVQGDLGWPAVVLYIAGLLWTLGYDTIYAHQDKVDDALIGIKSSARYLGAATPRWLWRFYAAALVLIAVAGSLADMGPAFYLMLALAGAHLAWQVHTLELDDPRSCLVRFRSNREFGWLVFLALLAGKAGP
jgi:4-hydroxybenzoate polyprenyltransferase